MRDEAETDGLRRYLSASERRPAKAKPQAIDSKAAGAATGQFSGAGLFDLGRKISDARGNL